MKQAVARNNFTGRSANVNICKHLRNIPAESRQEYSSSNQKQKYKNMNLHEYYRNHKDAINSSIMEIACDLAVGRLLTAHDAPFETFVEADDPDDPDSGTHYKEEFQKEYNTYYDEEYARVATLMKFDYCQDDGVAASPEDMNT